MTLKERITEDMKVAMRARESERLSTIRMLLAAIKQREVDDRIVLDDSAVVAIVEKSIKQRRESIAQFTAGGREDMAAREAAEVEVLNAYLPPRLGDAEIDAAVADAVRSVGASGPQDMGKVMAVLKTQLAGQADMTTISAKVKALLAPAARA
ncbi:MAG: GatB/YqeY domain-containing protein [Janthinobacterium lividum]